MEAKVKVNFKQYVRLALSHAKFYQKTEEDL